MTDVLTRDQLQEEDRAIMAASARILDKYRDAYIALGGVKDVLAAKEERTNGYVGRHAEDVLVDIDKILDGVGGVDCK